MVQIIGYLINTIYYMGYLLSESEKLFEVYLVNIRTFPLERVQSCSPVEVSYIQQYPFMRVSIYCCVRNGDISSIS